MYTLSQFCVFESVQRVVVLQLQSVTWAGSLSLSACEPVGWVLCELVVVGKCLGGDNCQLDCEQIN